jgi:hypothetical protein
MRILLGAFLLIALTSMLNAQILSIEVISIDKAVSFPIITSNSRPEVAARINDLLQYTYFDTLFTKKTIKAVVADQISNPELHHHLDGWTLMEIINHQQNERYLKLDFQLGYQGAYDSNWTETFFFDLKNGLRLEVPSFFSIEGFYDFLNKNWLDGCFEQVEEAHACETGERQLEGECYTSCFDFEEFYIRDGSLVLTTNDCYPHVLQNCNPIFEKAFSLSSISPYFSGYGRYLLLGEQNDKSLPRSFFLSGKLDDKYHIRMALEQDVDDASKWHGYYFYEKHKKKIKLEGILKGNIMTLKEYLDNNFFNGEFRLEWDETYFPTGTWTDKNMLSKMDVELRWIYNSNMLNNK